MDTKHVFQTFQSISIMRFSMLWVFGILSISILGCTQKPTDASSDTDLPTFRVETFERTTDPCDESKNYCVKMSAVYPVLDSGLTPSVATIINDSILNYVKGSLAFLEPGADFRQFSLDALADSLFQSYKIHSQEAEYLTVWELEVSGEVLYLSKHFTSVSIENFGFTGGAHPYSNTILINFDLKTGKVLNILDLIKDKKGLEAVAEKAFRKSRELDETADLNEAGFFWEEGFQLPTNIGVVQEGLYCYYNSYEIAAYAWGPTDFVLTWEELGTLFDKTRIE